MSVLKKIRKKPVLKKIALGTSAVTMGAGLLSTLDADAQTSSMGCYETQSVECGEVTHSGADLSWTYSGTIDVVDKLIGGLSSMFDMSYEGGTTTISGGTTVLCQKYGPSPDRIIECMHLKCDQTTEIKKC